MGGTGLARHFPLRLLSADQARQRRTQAGQSGFVEVRKLRGEVMAAGDLWLVNSTHKAIEVSGSTRSVLRLCFVRDDWPFPEHPREVSRALCEKLPSRREREFEEALL